MGLLDIRDKKEINSYKLNSGLEGHFRVYSNVFKNDKTLDDNILIANPVPSNVKRPRVLDPVVEVLLKNKNANTTISKDNKLARVQEKITNVMGPFSKAWSAVENLLQCEQNGEEAHLNPEELVTQMRQSALLLGQSIVAVNHLRRFNVLTAISSNKEAGTTLRAHQELLEKDSSELFGSDFRCEQEELRKEITALEKVYKPPPKQPFPTGPSSTSSGFKKVGGGQSIFNTGYKRGGYSGGGGRGKFANHLFLYFTQKGVSFQVPPTHNQDHSSMHSPIKTSGTPKILHSAVEKSYERPGNPGDCKRLEYTFPKPPHTGECHLKYPQGRERGSKKGSVVLIGERSHTTNQTTRRADFIKPVLN